MARVEATGAEHTFQPDELFFSITDSKGIIEQANSVFVRLSRYSRDQLIGAPHNIIRHDDMPGGAFKLVWDVLEAGAPVCAYVKNLAADGSAYWVFATITPLNGGYLSVRCKPCRPDLLDAAYGLYQVVRPHELQARQDGVSAARAAEQGLGELAGLLAGAGFPSYIDFMLLALPAEVEARSALSGGIPVRPEAAGPLAEMLGSVTAIDRDVQRLVGELGQYQKFADDLGHGVEAAKNTVEQLGQSVAAAETASETVGGKAPVLVNTTRAIAKQALGAVAKLAEIAEAMGDLRVRVAELRFRIALAKLHNDMVALFVTELIDEVPQHQDAFPAIPELATALDEGIRATAADLQECVGLSAGVVTQINDARKNLAEVQSLMANWRIFVTRYGVSGELTSMLPTIDAQLKQGFEAVVLLSDMSRECSAAARPFDTRPILGQLQTLRHAVADFKLHLAERTDVHSL